MNDKLAGSAKTGAAAIKAAGNCGADAGAADDAVVDFPFTSKIEDGRELGAQDRAALSSSSNTGSA